LTTTITCHVNHTFAQRKEILVPIDGHYQKEKRILHATANRATTKPQGRAEWTSDPCVLAMNPNSGSNGDERRTKRRILTTAIQAVSDLLVSVNVLLKEALDFGLVVRQFVWAHSDQIL
jgi:hypothetical protein